eukprot:1156933-Pelagomonas_calceolata.AAC.1
MHTEHHMHTQGRGSLRAVHAHRASHAHAGQSEWHAPALSLPAPGLGQRGDLRVRPSTATAASMLRSKPVRRVPCWCKGRAAGWAAGVARCARADGEPDSGLDCLRVNGEADRSTEAAGGRGGTEAAFCTPMGSRLADGLAACCTAAAGVTSTKPGAAMVAFFGGVASSKVGVSALHEECFSAGRGWKPSRAEGGMQKGREASPSSSKPAQVTRGKRGNDCAKLAAEECYVIGDNQVLDVQQGRGWDADGEGGRGPCRSSFV